MRDRLFQDELKGELLEIAEDLKAYLHFARGLGFQNLPLVDAGPVAENMAGAGFSTDTLEGIEKDLEGCQRCKLHRGRRNLVFGAGNPRARLVLVGEGPGYEEDQQGVPFVGEAGQLLTKILKAINLTREEVYICNVVKCRPPGNRNPEKDEVVSCLPFLKRQIAAIKPRFICALGAVAAQTLLETEAPMFRLRGVFHRYGNISLLPTYHPAFLLRNPEKKRDVWEDVQKLQAAYEKE